MEAIHNFWSGYLLGWLSGIAVLCIIVHALDKRWFRRKGA